LWWWWLWGPGGGVQPSFKKKAVYKGYEILTNNEGEKESYRKIIQPLNNYRSKVILNTMNLKVQ
jgi:hypothetical protein